MIERISVDVDAGAVRTNARQLPCCSALDVVCSASVDSRSRPSASKPIKAPIANNFLQIGIEAIP